MRAACAGKGFGQPLVSMEGPMLNRLLGATAIGALIATGASVVSPQVAEAQVADPDVACRIAPGVLLDEDGNNALDEFGAALSSSS